MSKETHVGTINIMLGEEPVAPRFQRGDTFRWIEIPGGTSIFMPVDPNAARVWLENLSAVIVETLKSYS